MGKKSDKQLSEDLMLYAMMQPKRESAPEPYCREVNMTVNRQSTADDAKLLKQLHDEAVLKIRDAYVIEVGDNRFGYAALEVCEDYMAHKKQVWGHFTLNGKRFDVKTEASYINHDDTRSIVQAIAKSLAEEITQQLLQGDDWNHFRSMKRA